MHTHYTLCFSVSLQCVWKSERLKVCDVLRHNQKAIPYDDVGWRCLPSINSVQCITELFTRRQARDRVVVHVIYYRSQGRGRAWAACGLSWGLGSAGTYGKFQSKREEAAFCTHVSHWLQAAWLGWGREWWLSPLRCGCEEDSCGDQKQYWGTSL